MGVDAVGYEKLNNLILVRPPSLTEVIIIVVDLNLRRKADYKTKLVQSCWHTFLPNGRLELASELTKPIFTPLQQTRIPCTHTMKYWRFDYMVN